LLLDLRVHQPAFPPIFTLFCLCLYIDLAVGAPYEDKGAVYVFHGSARGILPEFSQRISAREFPGVMRGGAFGASLSPSPVDLDNNGYPDLVIGQIILLSQSSYCRFFGSFFCYFSNVTDSTLLTV